MTLDQIKRHPCFPFRNYSGDDLEFLMLELYWAELFKDALRESVSGYWTPEWPAEPDGNPILFVSNRNIVPPRQLRVIQQFNDQRLPELDLDTYAPVPYERDAYVPFVPGLTYGGLDADMVTPIEELVIRCETSGICERLFRDYVALWCVERVSQERMAVVLDDYWQRVEASLIQRGT